MPKFNNLYIILQFIINVTSRTCVLAPESAHFPGLSQTIHFFLPISNFFALLPYILKFKENLTI